MIDTFQISKTFVRSPNLDDLEINGWKPLRDQRTGERRGVYLNAPKNERQPRLTLARNRNALWNIRAEVSIGSWLFNSNLHLPVEAELFESLGKLSEYVETKSGIVFDARTERVTRVDFTRDFKVEEVTVIPVIAKFSDLDMPRYNRLCYDETSVYFKNSGKAQTKQFLIYSKYHERLAKSKNVSEQESAKGLIRLEISFRKKGVNALAKQLKLKNHHANYILTKETSERVMQAAMKKLNFASFLNHKTPTLKELFDSCGSAAALNRIGFLFMCGKFGKDFAKLTYVNLSPKTLKRYGDDCNKIGLSSLE